MTWEDEALLFDCAGERLVGVLSRPRWPVSVGVLVVVGGPQYRAGGHRQFILLARALAGAGYPVLRFDRRGMGDSSGAAVGFEAASEDIGAAMDALLAACPELETVVLWGLCDGASAALLYRYENRDPRIGGLVLLNPWVRSDESLSRTRLRHYYGQRLCQGEFWRKLLRGRVALGAALGGIWRDAGRLLQAGAGQLPDTSFQTRMALAWRDFDGPLLLVLSGRDYTAREFLDYAASDADWSGLLQRPRVRRVDLPDADHTFSSHVLRRQLEQAVLGWLAESWPTRQEKKCAAS